MKISFLTSCLEPEHDGVGDYTRLLAAECKRAGHATCLIALNDSQCGQVHRDQRPLRLSAALPWADRIKIAKEYLDDFSPDFVSLQFVCYGFHPRGIDWSLAGSLKSIIGSVPVQVMFHELWIGGQIGASLKDRFLGILQRRGVLNILQQLPIRRDHVRHDPEDPQLHPDQHQRRSKQQAGNAGAALVAGRSRVLAPPRAKRSGAGLREPGSYERHGKSLLACVTFAAYHGETSRRVRLPG